MSKTWKISAVGLGVVAMTGLIGCGSDGVVTADLEFVDSSIASRSDLFLDPTLENRPMTLDQLGGERASAIPVEVEVFGPVAAAWRRGVHGETLPRNADTLVSLWRVYDVRSGRDLSTAQTTERELEGGIDYVPSTSELPRVDGVDIERPGDRISNERPDEHLFLLVDWRDRLGFLHEEDIELARMLNENHPGCL